LNVIIRGRQKMMGFREKPKFGVTEPLAYDRGSDDDSWGCILMPLGIVISYFVLSAILRVTSNSGSKLDQIICYGTLICFVIIMLVGVRDERRKSKAEKAERKRWAEDCKPASLTIVSRRVAISWWDDYSNRYRNAPNSLGLEMNSDQKAASPNRTIVNVEVSQYVYERLEKCSTARIYYKPETPLVFLLEDEI
jgi:hypothetical protein